MIRVTGLEKTYRRGVSEVRALAGVSLEIADGEFVAIMGASGSGKSTLMHLLGLLDTPDAGSYLLDGREVSALGPDELAQARSARIGFVFQQFHLLARTSARENVLLPGVYSDGGPVEPARAQRLLEALGVGERASHKPGELSGGQQQRVAIARALVNRPTLLLADEPTGNLDTASSREIMRVFRDLNRSGITVVVVTHEPDIARYASRIVVMRDGRVVSDAPNGEPIPYDNGGGPMAPTAEEADEALTRGSKRLRGAGAAWTAHVREALRALATNKVRSGLSTLGILIGVAAVIAMVAVGLGAQKSIKAQLSDLGSNLLTVRPGAFRSGGVNLGQGAVSRLTEEDAAAIAAVKGVARVSVESSGTVQAVAGASNWNTSVRGASPSYADINSAHPTVGRFFGERENRERARVAVIGMTVQRHLFGDANPLGETILLNRVIFQVVGVLPAKGSNGFMDRDDVVVIPVETALHRLFGKTYPDSIGVQVADAKDMDTVQSALGDLLRKRHRIAPSQDDDFEVQNFADIQKAVSATTTTLSALLAIVAGISLLVGGIGIMNIMLVSVTERTREIGLRKALGARGRDVLAQFLVEAAVIAALGGLGGVLLGCLVSWTISAATGWATEISWVAVGAAVAFSSGVGVVFGYWPARKAAGLDPITALRYE
jgi:macrolide transport system ATP-binding/permease protein